MGKRRVIHIDGIQHKAPIPAAVRIGDMVFSSAIGGRDPETGTYPDDPAEQARLAFAHVVTLMREVGGDVDDIAHVTVYLKDPAHKQYVDDEWVRMFPDPEDRPARHAVPTTRAGAMLLQLEFVAVLGQPEVTR